MAKERKLGRATDQRQAMIKNLVTELFRYGKIETTYARAKEVQVKAEKIITTALSAIDDFTSTTDKISKARLDSKGNKILVSVTSKNGNKYDKVEREEKNDMVTVDSAKRLHCRRLIIRWINKVKDEDGNNLNIVNKIFDEIAPKYKDRKGGYTKIFKLGPRRGDSAEVAIIKLVD